MSRDTKKELIMYTPMGDSAAMARHLEKMAAKGWLLERADNWWLRYRRAEPVQVHYAVAFFPDATIFDAKPLEDQETYYDYCQAAGWEYVCSYGSTQYFRNSRPNPVPIETDEALKLKALSRVMLRTAVLVDVVWLLMALFRFSSLRDSFRWNTLSMISQYTTLGAVLSIATFFIRSLAGLLCVGVWYLYSRWSVKRGGACARIRGSLQMAGDFIALGVMLVGLGITCVGQGRSGTLFIVIYMAGYFFLAIIMRALMRLFKRWNFSNTVNLGCLIAAAVVLAIALTYSMYAVDRYLDKAMPPEWPKEIASMEAPLTLENLGFAVTEEDQCGYMYEKSNQTPWAVYDSYYTTSPAGGNGLPYLEYGTADIPWDWLREWCWDTIMKGPKYRNRWLTGFTSVDPAPWGADDAAKRNDSYVLLYGNRIVRVSTGWTPTDEQAAVIGEKLSGQVRSAN